MIALKKLRSLSFHPDKLPDELKEIASRDKSINIFVSRVFDAIKNESNLSKSDLIRYINYPDMVGGKKLRLSHISLKRI